MGRTTALRIISGPAHTGRAGEGGQERGDTHTGYVWDGGGAACAATTSRKREVCGGHIMSEGGLASVYAGCRNYFQSGRATGTRDKLGWTPWHNS